MPNVGWEDIGGLENVKRELQEVMKKQSELISSLHFTFVGLY